MADSKPSEWALGQVEQAGLACARRGLMHIPSQDIVTLVDAAEQRGFDLAITVVKSRLAPRALGSGINRGTLIKLATIYDAIDTIERTRGPNE